MKKLVLLAGALSAGLMVAPQTRAGFAVLPAGQIAGVAHDEKARKLARGLRRHGFWGFGRSRILKGQLYLQAYRGKGVPVMVVVGLESGRVVAVKKFSRRHVRQGVAIPKAALNGPHRGQSRKLRRRS